MVKVIRELVPPGQAGPAGYAWCINRFGLDLPTPPTLAAIRGKHRPHWEGAWQLFPVSYMPDPDLASHLTFALKYEGVNLAALDALCRKIPAATVADAVRSAPTGAYMRRLWFLYEWLTVTQLDMPDASKVKAVNVVDDRQQLALTTGEISSRHRVRDNLPGAREFCPMVRRTSAIARAQELGLAERARSLMGRTHPDLVARAAAFLLLSDSQASFRIEGETPSPDRARRWGQAIALAGATRLSIEELENLQRMVIGDARFVHIGLRTDGGFVGDHDRTTGAPLPDHVSAKPGDLQSLVGGIAAYDERTRAGEFDAVAAAAVAAFGLVYVHPFDDGNGRIHRWLIHHVLAANEFTPLGMVFPVSAVMLRELSAYRRVLESYSKPLLARIEWQSTERGNVEVLNDTSSWYRYFDATVHVEFLYACVEETVKNDLPQELSWLDAYDRFASAVARIVDMPTRTVDLLHRFLRQNNGSLSQRARTKEFNALTDEEVSTVERAYTDSIAASAG